MIHTEFPSYNFPKCKPQLMDHGICYPITALMFNPMFYTEKIRMNKDEGNLFSMWVQKEVKKADELVKGRGRERSVLELKTVRILILKNLEKAVTHMHYCCCQFYSQSPN